MKDNKNVKKPKSLTNITKPKKVKTKKQITKKAKKEIRIKKPLKERLLNFLKWFLISIVAVGIVMVIGLGIFIKSAIDEIPEYDINDLFSLDDISILYDKDGNEFARIGLHNRESIKYEDLPDVLIDSLIAIEDSKFFVHNGVDYARFSKAVFDVFTTGSFSGSGASTLTMQVAKNAITNPENKSESTIQSIKRKIQDVYLATFVIEKNFTKEEILEYYLNRSFLGGNIYGVQAAAEEYFDKDVTELNLLEASFIVGLFQSPNAYSPYQNDPERGEVRRNIVLDLMVRHGFLDQETADIAKTVKLESYIAGPRNNSGEYVDYINRVVEEIKDRGHGDPYVVPMKIYTNMDRDLQDFLNTIKSGDHKDITYPDEMLQLGLAMIDTETSKIRGLIGGRNTVAKGYNYATNVKRMIGSTAKPLFSYGPCFEFLKCTSDSGYILDDAYWYKDGTRVYNWDNDWKNLLTYKKALATSRNIPALKIFHRFTKEENEKVSDFVEGLGITPQHENGNGKYLFESHSLGSFEPGATPLEMAAAYAAFGNDGIYTEPLAVRHIVLDTIEGKIEFEAQSDQAMNPDTAFMVTQMLKNSVESNYGFVGYIRHNKVKNAAKTGTTNWPWDYVKELGIEDNSAKDLYLVNYNPHYSIGFWMGYGELDEEYVENNWIISNTTGQIRLRNKIVDVIHESEYMPKDGKQFNFSTKNIVQRKYEKETIPLKLPSNNTPEEMIGTGFFIKGTEPTEVSDRFLLKNNASNLSASYDSTTGNITLTWNKANVPNVFNYSWLNNYFTQTEHYGAKVFKPHFHKHMARYVEENLKYMGDIGYVIKMYNADTQEFIKDINFISLANNRYKVTPTEYKDYLGLGKLNFSIQVKTESGSSTGTSYSNSVTLSGNTLIRPYLPTTDGSYNPTIKRQYKIIKYGENFSIPSINFYNPEALPEPDPIVEDPRVKIRDTSGNPVGHDQPRYVAGSTFTITFDSEADQIETVKFEGEEISSGHSFKAKKGTNYTIEVTAKNDEDSGEPIFETYNIIIISLDKDPLETIIPTMSLVPQNQISKTIYYLDNSNNKVQVDKINTTQLGNYQVVYSYTNSNGYTVKAYKFFKVHKYYQDYLNEQKKNETKLREER